jgi:hypothetical protein
MQSGVRRCPDGPRLDGAVSAIKLVLVVLPFKSFAPNAHSVTDSLSATLDDPPQTRPAKRGQPGAQLIVWDQPSGLRTGSPPFPPPRLIRLTVRLLLRSPRLSGPGPHQWPTSSSRQLRPRTKPQ